MVLIDAAVLAQTLSEYTVLDVRWRLGDPAGTGRAGYLAGHLPGAAFLDLEADVCGPPVRGPLGGARHPLPDPAVLQAALRRAGVTGGQPIVTYDWGDGLAAARLWWTLRWAGHGAVRVLRGGLAAWTGALESGEPPHAAGDFTVRPGQLPVLDAAGAARLAQTGTLYDARAAPRFRGEVEPVDPVAGHIPGAVNAPNASIVEAPAGPVGAYCGSGVTAAAAILALHELGRPDAALYVGSWSDWVSDPGRPVARGDQ